MQEIWPQLKHWVRKGVPFAVATVVEASRPSPRGVGSVLAVRSDGDAFIGSVSAGCVESEVIESAKACMVDGEVAGFRLGRTAVSLGRFHCPVVAAFECESNPLQDSRIRIWENGSQGF